MSAVTDVAPALQELAATVRAGGRALVALDFDGTLAPLQDDPEASRALPEAVTALRELGSVPGVHLALVSGRALDDLADKAEVPEGTYLVGSHGGERARVVRGGLERTDLRLPPAAAELLQDVADVLGQAVTGTTARLEHKPAAVVLHTRTASADDAARLTALATDLGDRDGVDALRGKDVVELSVLRVTKGDALADLRRELGVDALLFAGDDVTDERAFTTLGPGDLTVRVGGGETAARFRVAGCAEMAGALARLARDLRPGG